MGCILVVDDQELIRTLVRNILTGAGHEVGVAADGEEALRLLGAHQWDLMVCDVAMPGISGLDLLRRVKRDRPALKVIVLTGYARDHDISQFLLAGADEYLVKPFTTDGLLDPVRRLLEHAGRDVAERRRS